MSFTNRHMRREVIRNTLSARTGGAPDARAVAAALLDTWQNMASRLEPVVGARGVDALFGRALHLAGNTFPWLAATGVRGNSATSLASLKTCFEGQKTSVAMDAACALLATFIELLASLIGESLTERLVGGVWDPSHPETQQQRQA